MIADSPLRVELCAWLGGRCNAATASDCPEAAEEDEASAVDYYGERAGFAASCGNGPSSTCPGLAGALELLAENQPVVGHAYETLHMLGAAAKIAGGSGAAQSSLNSIRIVQVDWGSVRSGHSGIFKGYNLIIGEGANVYTIESTFGEILNWKPDWLITRDLLFAAGVERLDQLKFQKYTGKEGKVVPTGMIHGGARYVPAAVLERKETTAAALLDYKCMREGCGNVFKATGTTTTDMRCVNGTKVGCQSTKVVRVKLAYKAVGEGGAMKIKLSREAEPL